ncbi:transcriptional regulator, HxlR family [Chitinophaga rupis]|uniref:Transcriptional regulator, HxlR family n=1 Tax=Chitinophaga rupis TaxID=573321 RepID=A0A1H7HS76_9BACT|nr:helix-turn-helix domain-containing protein [Chitinophaga rupis]SEK51055.1 transcriptional regulator, HxlR family [Chitinophaga rupis]
MYQKKLPEDLECGITITMRSFGGKWKPCIIDAIDKGFRRPSELHKVITEATPRVIDLQLRELETAGIVYKETGSGFPLYTAYYLTEKGESILPILALMNSWGLQNKSGVHDLQHQKKNRVICI